MLWKSICLKKWTRAKTIEILGWSIYNHDWTQCLIIVWVGTWYLQYLIEFLDQSSQVCYALSIQACFLDRNSYQLLKDLKGWFCWQTLQYCEIVCEGESSWSLLGEASACNEQFNSNTSSKWHKMILIYKRQGPNRKPTGGIHHVNMNLVKYNIYIYIFCWQPLILDVLTNVSIIYI